jgi:predicted RNA-binding Zn-ribbon protein involved in translation (DUF1610 family)
MSFQSKLPCPDCGQDILIESSLLLAGSSFSCPNRECGVTIKLDTASLPQVKSAYEQFEQLKQSALDAAEDSSSR